MKTHRNAGVVRMALLLLLAMLPDGRSLGQTATSAKDIDQFVGSMKITNKYGAVVGSPLDGLGTVFIGYGSQYSVDPRLLVAISGAESSFGVRICAQNNAWNWFWHGTCTESPFDSWNSGVETVSHFMKKSYILHGYNTVDLIGARYCASGCSHWVPNVTSYLKSMGGNPESLTWDGTVSTTTPSGSDQGNNAGPNTTPTGGNNTGPSTTIGESGSGTPESSTGPTELPSVPEQVLPPVITMLPAGSHWWNFGSGTTKVGVSTGVSGKALIANSVQLWQELPNQTEAMLTQLNASGTGDSGQTIFSGTATLNGGLPAELWVSASYRDGSLVHVRSSSLAAVSAPTSGSSTALVVVAIVGVLILLVGIVLIVMLAKGRKLKAA